MNAAAQVLRVPVTKSKMVYSIGAVLLRRNL